MTFYLIEAKDRDGKYTYPDEVTPLPLPWLYLPVKEECQRLNREAKEKGTGMRYKPIKTSY